MAVEGHVSYLKMDTCVIRNNNANLFGGGDCYTTR